ncbi:metal-sulfur cluster assembly factor [Kamptonema cortianum]|nr:metal-sulfur cluster assembly factor [Oscillatoria laete-virens]MDK3157882.1 metal-sulfur cluster assembly factor [Kamptonema cortianum]MDL5046012.1 metal-sulfur cluster assembly factor [Oscillatoria amoena NRMC-F 0135]MDL5052718.1 metal-sulfur cluster assembly factor [Oscillatoria laete-virens NRMC-F 0139]
MSAEKSKLTVEEIYTALKNCYDPEIPVNIVDLGLVYDVVLEGNGVRVKMSLTTPGCHMGPSIANDAQSKVMAVEGVESCQVDIVWDPPWNQSMITEDGRKKLGMA